MSDVEDLYKALEEREAELADVRRQWAADAGSLAARLATEQDETRRLRALLVEQADIITANIWHIPPEYAARNILLDVAVKMREATALRGEPAPATGREE